MVVTKKSHHTWSQCLFCPDLTTVIHCWPAYHVKPLQRVQNAAVSLVLYLGLRDHATPGLQQLHWLPVEHRITFKLYINLYSPFNMVETTTKKIKNKKKNIHSKLLHIMTVI